MFSIISRRSSRARNAYICSSCLGHVEQAHLPGLLRTANATANATFSTTSTNWQDEGTDAADGVTDSAVGEAASRLKSKRRKRVQLTTGEWRALQKAKMTASQRGLKPPLGKLSGSAKALDALKESMLAEDMASIPTTDGAIVVSKESGKGGKKGKVVVGSKKTVALGDEGTSTKGAIVGKKNVTKVKKTSSSKSKSGTGVDEIKSTDAEDLDVSKVPKKAKEVKEGKVPKTFKITKHKSTAPRNLKQAALDLHMKSKKASEIPARRLIRKIVDKASTEEEPSFTITKQIKDVGAPWAKKWVDAIASNQDGGSGFKRQMLLKLIEKGNLSPKDVGPAVELLRNAIQEDQEHRLEHQKSIKQAMQERPAAERISRRAAPTMKGSPRGTKKDPKLDETNTNSPMRGTTKLDIQSINASDLKLVPLDTGPLDVPKLSYGLERVLFNPGVYQLQDPRSRVFNFDPYLQTIMPVSEFDFNALKEYITSSRDDTLLGIAKAEKRKYTGSTSSMTSALGHFHFLLSQWRPINAGTLSRDFPAEFSSFTALQRGPTAIFLRYRDGVYAIDADKEFDTANILSSLGKSMEKLLTLPTDDFEKYRKPNSDQITQEERDADEAFHYTTMGDFLMRSQLDAYDPRLPGTGMFDLKTRAVVAIRMDTTKYEEGSGYEIRKRHGEWESFEREYYDMIRAAFLKYSLQVRMGRMDGIFVAFHNTERIFGFQYISLSEMDMALHGTDDISIGDSEFKLSVDLMNRVLDRATAKYPEKSLRLFFETREGDAPFMYIFAEPVEEKEIDQIQTSNKAEIEEFESRVLGLEKEASEEEKRQAEWDSLYSKVEETMEQDESGLVVDEENAVDDHHGEHSGVWDAEERQKVEDFINTAAQEDGAPDEEEEEEDDEEDETDLVDADDEEIDNNDEVVEEHEEDGEEHDDGVELEEHDDSLDENSEEDAKVDILEDGELLPEDVENETSEEFNIEEENKEEITKGEFVPDEQESQVGETSEETLDEELEAEKEAEVEKTSGDTESGIEDHSEETSMEEQEDINEVEESETLDPSSDSSEDPAFAIRKVSNGTQPTPGDEEDIFAMTLTIRNKVNNAYVKRPNDLTASDEWTVEYSLAEVKDPNRARKLYLMAKERRSKVLNRSGKKSSAWNEGYVESLMNIARKGREWRKGVDEKERESGRERVVLDLRDVSKAGVGKEGKGGEKEE